MDVQLAAESATDLESVEQLLISAQLPHGGLRAQFPPAYVVARDERAIVGIAGLEHYGDVGLLRSVAVTGARRGAGVGRLLVANRLAHARESRLSAVYLLTTTASDYFTRLDFAPASRAEVPADLQASEEFARACPASAACLVWRPNP